MSIETFEPMLREILSDYGPSLVSKIPYADLKWLSIAYLRDYGELGEALACPEGERRLLEALEKGDRLEAGRLIESYMVGYVSPILQQRLDEYWANYYMDQVVEG